MAKKNVVIYYGGFLERTGGAFFHAINLKSELEKLDWEVEVITLDRLPFWCRYVPHLIEKIINFIQPPKGFIFKGLITKNLYRYFFRSQPNLQIFEDIHLTWNSEIPSLTMLHAVWSDNIQAYRYSQKNYNVLISAELSLINSIDHSVITVSEPYRTYLEKKHFQNRLTKEIEVVPLGIDQSMFANISSGNRKGKSIVYCGTLEARKNLFFLIEVFTEICHRDSDYKLTLIGDGPDRNSLEEAVRKHGLNVLFKGRLSHEEVIRELHDHDIYIHTSLKESFSYSLLEAKLSGLKTCASSALEVPKEFIDLAFDDFSVAAWSEAILQLDMSQEKFNGDQYTASKMTAASLEKCSFN